MVSMLRSWVPGGVALATVSALLLAAPQAQTAEVSDCFGQVPTIVGTELPDVLQGTSGADVISGLGGNDELHGLGGNDRICGGGGSDEILGGDGRDRLGGGADRTSHTGEDFPSGDSLAGGPGNDVVHGGEDDGHGDVVSFAGAAAGVEVDLTAGTSTGEGADTITGVDGILGSRHGDTLKALRGGEVHAGAGADRLTSAPGMETLWGQAGADVLVLGHGDNGWGFGGADVFRMRDSGDATAWGDGGSDTYVGGAGGDTFYEVDDDSDSVDVARGGGGNDSIALGRGDDRAWGGAGHDYVYADPGDDRVDGGHGVDTYGNGLSAIEGIRVNLRRGVSSGAGDDELRLMENADGTSSHDVLIGDSGDNVFFGGPGNDTLKGGAGSDHLDGHDGTDEAVGGPGDDYCVAEKKRGCER